MDISPNIREINSESGKLKIDDNYIKQGYTSALSE